MRKLIIIVVLALSIFLAYETVVVGVDFGTELSIPNYKEVEKSSRDIDTLISQLVNVNDIEFNTKKSSLASSIKNYKNKKEEYEAMVAMVEENTSEEISLVDIYDVDFLWTTIGNYGTEEGIKLQFDVVRSVTSSISSNEYTMCDLRFTVSGDYIAITDFIYDIEDDSKLGFEISNFSIAKGGENLQATFTVKEVPINNTNLTQLTQSTDIGDKSMSSSDKYDSNTSSSGNSSSKNDSKNDVY